MQKIQAAAMLGILKNKTP